MKIYMERSEVIVGNVVVKIYGTTMDYLVMKPLCVKTVKHTIQMRNL